MVQNARIWSCGLKFDCTLLRRRQIRQSRAKNRQKVIFGQKWQNWPIFARRRKSAAHCPIFGASEFRCTKIEWRRTKLANWSILPKLSIFDDQAPKAPGPSNFWPKLAKMAYFWAIWPGLWPAGFFRSKVPIFWALLTGRGPQVGVLIKMAQF